MIRRPPRSTQSRSSAASDVYKRQPVDVTVFRKLKPLDYLSSYSHRGRFYTLREIARFDDHGLWSQADVWFSRFGTLLATAEVFVNRSPRGFFAEELARALHVEVQDALHQLTQQRRVTREMVSGLYLYTATDRDIQRGQLLTRRTVEALPTVPDASVRAVSEGELMYDPDFLRPYESAARTVEILPGGKKTLDLKLTLNK